MEQGAGRGDTRRCGDICATARHSLPSIESFFFATDEGSILRIENKANNTQIVDPFPFAIRQSPFAG